MFKNSRYTIYFFMPLVLCTTWCWQDGMKERCHFSATHQMIGWGKSTDQFSSTMIHFYLILQTQKKKDNHSSSHAILILKIKIKLTLLFYSRGYFCPPEFTLKTCVTIRKQLANPPHSSTRWLWRNRDWSLTQPLLTGDWPADHRDTRVVSWW